MIPVNVKSAEELDLNETEVIELLKVKDDKVHRCIGITLNILRPKVSVFDTGARLNMVCTSFLPSQMARPHPPHPQHGSLVCLKQPCSRRRRTYAFGSAGRPTGACPLWRCGQSRRTGTNWDVADRQVCQASITHGTTNHPHVVSPNCNHFRTHAPSDPLAVSHINLEAETNTEGRQDNGEEHRC